MATFKENGKLKYLNIVGTRLETIRLSAVINECRRFFDCLLALVRQLEKKIFENMGDLEELFD